MPKRKFLSPKGRGDRGEGYRYVILGSGKQGTAAAYDLVRHGEAKSVLLADQDPSSAKRASDRLHRLLRTVLREKGTVLKTAGLDASDVRSTAKLLSGADAVLSALPYYLNPTAARAAVAARVPYADLGGHLKASRDVLGLDRQAKKAGIALVPDTGLAPGLATSLAVAAIENLDMCREVKIYCGGLPQKPRPPLGYKAVYNLEGLMAVYFGKAYQLVRGRVEEVPTLTGDETVEFPPPLGTLEASVTGGGTATCPWSFLGRLQGFEYKTLRYPGHFDKIRTLRDLGLLDDRPVRLNGHEVVPRKLFLEVAGPRLQFPEDHDLVALRVAARGSKHGGQVQVVYDLLDFHDEATGFSAMERTTGFSAAIVLKMLAGGRIAAKGGVPVEKGVPAKEFLAELRIRRFRVQETRTQLGRKR